MNSNLIHREKKREIQYHRLLNKIVKETNLRVRETDKSIVEYLKDQECRLVEMSTDPCA